ncbi:hypothetical protein CEXT_326841 [Caerostris extrusa]|uniref:Uncharacterized protein n=1 Tax=Caerostris extrusa TaxID=172846 RepID=A0AAV4T035_CAEEX|nr:hypothetical protein CEXT_326841 [Caerostris extrusa]
MKTPQTERTENKFEAKNAISFIPSNHPDDRSSREQKKSRKKRNSNNRRGINIYSAPFATPTPYHSFPIREFLCFSLCCFLYLSRSLSNVLDFHLYQTSSRIKQIKTNVNL